MSSPVRKVDWVAAAAGLLMAAQLVASLSGSMLGLPRPQRLLLHAGASVVFLLFLGRRQWLFGADGRLRPVWRFFDGLLVFVAANVVAAGIGNGIARSDSSRLFHAIYRPLAMLLAVLGFSGLLWAVDRVRSATLPAQGLPFDAHARRDALIGALLAYLMVTACWLAIAIGGTLTYQFQLTPAEIGMMLVQLLALAGAAMLEEVGFRGYPFQRLVDGAGAPVAILVLSGFFGLVHANNPGASLFSVTNTALIGAVFCVAYLRTQALWLPFGLHWGWNATLGIVYGLPVSGVDLTAGIKAQADGPVWLTGGAYGIEAAPTATVTILLGLLVMLRWFPPRPAPAVTLDLPAPPLADASASGPPPPDLPPPSGIQP